MGQQLHRLYNARAEEELTMQELFSKNKNFLSESTEDWLIEMIK